jgi:alanyl aminopeptidase
MSVWNLSWLRAAVLCGLMTALAGCDVSSEQAATSESTIAESRSAAAEIPTGRLPEGIAPVHYRLHLTIDPRESRFSGRVEIDMVLNEPAEAIWIHGNEIEMDRASAKVQGDEIELGWTQVSDIGVVRLEFERPLPAGTATLVFDYTAPFNTNLEGLYRVDASDGNAYAYTQFESTSARLAFPSFDEPAFKVPFDIEMTVPTGFTGITNTPLESARGLGNGMTHLQFARSKPMPTYLVAFAVGPFDVVEWQPVQASSLRDTPIPLRGITTSGKGEQIRFALENTEKIVLGLENYFGTAYPYAKLDIIAVPDFSAGAMENVGAITYREQLLLLDEDAPVYRKRSYFGTHTHELAHQWFGNLVTPEWWDDIWLNESFATWNAAAVLHKLFPEENYRDSMSARGSGVMELDSLASARQIREPVLQHEDIGAAFDGITYQKGGAVLTMFESFIGEDNFREGVRQYMEKHAWGNTTADDFIDAIAEANPQIEGGDLRRAFRSFIEQPGLPLISTELHCGQQAIELEINQKRYLPLGSAGSADQSWSVPACVSMTVDGEVEERCFLVNEPSQRVNLGIESCPEYVLPNARGASYYRWSLPPEGWQNLLAVLDSLTTPEQISVASSLRAALNAGEMSVDEFFAAMPAIAATDNWRVATAPLPDVFKIRDFVFSEQERKSIQARLLEWYGPRLDELRAMEELTPDQIQFKSRLRGILALDAKDETLRKELREAAIAWSGYGSDEAIHTDAVDPNDLDTALVVAVEDIGAPFAALLWKHFLKSTDMSQRQSLLVAMASSSDPEVSQTMLDRVLSPDLKDNEIYYVLFTQSFRPQTREQFWQWLQANMDGVLGRIPTWRKGSVPRLVSSFCSEDDAAAVEAVFDPFIHDLESGPRSLANTVERIRLCSAFADNRRG